MAKGLVRKVDDLGRIVIPKEYRKTYVVQEGDPLGMLVDGNIISMIKPGDKFIGIVRHVDELGRYTLPIEVRRTLGIETGQKVDVFIDRMNDAISIQKVGCEWCSNTEDLFEINGRNLCRKCAHSVVDVVMEG